MIYIKLFFEFFKIGLFSIGGGMATFPFLQEFADKYHWISSEELLDMIAISESTPGPIGINTATFTGYAVGGIPGGIIATLGIVTPSIIIIVIISYYFAKFYEQPIVKAGFYGLRPAVVGLISAAAFEVGKIALFNIKQYTTTYNIETLINFKAILLFALSLFLIYKYKKHPIVYLIGAAIAGIIFKF